MIVHLVPIAFLRFKKVTYYSVRLNNKAISEFRDFQQQLAANKANEIELAEINRYIENIGERTGAYPQHFKTEDAAERLPPPYHQFIEAEDFGDYGIRLYCIRLSPAVVILLNGNRKTALKVQDCTYCYPHFKLAVKLSKKITAAIQNGDMAIDDEMRELIIYDDFELTI